MNHVAPQDSAAQTHRRRRDSARALGVSLFVACVILWVNMLPSRPIWHFSQTAKEPWVGVRHHGWPWSYWVNASAPVRA